MSNKETEDTVPDAPPKEKLRTIMDAANALTSLGDEDGSNEAPAAKEEPNPEPEEVPATVGSAETPYPVKADEAPQPPSPPKSLPTESIPLSKRYLPEHKKPDAAPTFPEKVCIMYGALSLKRILSKLLTKL